MQQSNLQTAMRRLYDAKHGKLKRLSSDTCLVDVVSHSADSPWKTGAELVHEINRIWNAQEQLKKAERELFLLLEKGMPLEFEAPLAFGVVNFDGSLTAHRVVDHEADVNHDPGSLYRVLCYRSNAPTPIPLYTEEQIAGWDTLYLRGWAVVRGPSRHGRVVVKADPSDHEQYKRLIGTCSVGYPIPAVEGVTCFLSDDKPVTANPNCPAHRNACPWEEAQDTKAWLLQFQR